MRVERGKIPLLKGSGRGLEVWDGPIPCSVRQGFLFRSLNPLNISTPSKVWHHDNSLFMKELSKIRCVFGRPSPSHRKFSDFRSQLFYLCWKYDIMKISIIRRPWKNKLPDFFLLNFSSCWAHVILKLSIIRSSWKNKLTDSFFGVFLSVQNMTS